MSFIEHIIRIHSVLKYAGRFAPVENIQEAVRLVMQHYIKSEIIGHWLYCYTTELIGVQLMAIGFWYSKKHNAYIYSGYPKQGIADDESLDEIRERHGNYQLVGGNHV